MMAETKWSRMRQKEQIPHVLVGNRSVGGLERVAHAVMFAILNHTYILLS